ncbi:hypothetical protein LCGC14_0855580 [marine sediment metagenome]|uniref:Uncharacterized protein n=1 Tax=marine sediment metagenome TaxID=412755 RepID=A0A0F9PUB4_9ZZZZ
MEKKILAMIREIKKEKKDAIHGANMMGSMNPEYSANVSQYDYAIKKLNKLLGI